MANTITIDKFYQPDDVLTPIQCQLIKFLESNGPSMRKELVKGLDTPRTTVYDNLLKLQKRKLIEKFTRNNGLRGRPIVKWRMFREGL